MNERLEAVLRAVDAGEARTPDDLDHDGWLMRTGRPQSIGTQDVRTDDC